MKISCCIIGKNEIDDIGRCLNSIIDKVYEVIYIDTGSDDGTLEFVKKNYPKVKTGFYKWNDDFSAARNFALKKAKGDFLFYLDCDEEFVGEFPENLAQGIHNFEIYNLNDQGNHVVSVCSRMIANVKGVCFKGKIHEIFDSPQVKLSIFKFTTGHILHHGYKNSYREKKNKSERNVDTLTKAYNENKKSDVCFYLAQEYFIKKEYSKTEELTLEGINLIKDDDSLDQTFKPILYHLYLSSLIEQDKDAEVEKFEREMLDIGKNPESYVLLMNYYIKKNNEEKMLRYGFQGLKHINAQLLPVKFIEKNIKYVPYLAMARYYIKEKQDQLMGLYFLELAYGSGLDNTEVLVDIYNLLPKCERNIVKWEYYNNILYEKTKDKRLLKDMIGCYLANKDNEKNLKAIEICNELSDKEEKEKIKIHLKKIGREDLVKLVK